MWDQGLKLGTGRMAYATMHSMSWSCGAEAQAALYWRVRVGHKTTPMLAGRFYNGYQHLHSVSLAAVALWGSNTS